MNMWMTLAEFTPADRNRVIGALAIMMALVFVGGFAILLFRRKLNAKDDADSSADVGFSLSDLRRMRDDGEITAEEYEVTRARVVAKVRSSLSSPPKKDSGDNPNGSGLSPKNQP